MKKNNKSPLLSFLFFCFFLGSAHAQQIEENSELHKKIVATIKQKTDIDVERVEAQEGTELLVLYTNRGILYTNESADLLLQGNLISLKEEITNLTQGHQQAFLVSEIHKRQQDWIEFKASEEKQILHVLTSPSCGYCKKMHNDIQQYLDEGITIRYMALPRAGRDSEEFKNMSNTWCGTGTVDKFNRLMAGEQIPENTECVNKLESHISFNNKFGFSVTPILITQTGIAIEGYRPAKQLAAALAAQ